MPDNVAQFPQLRNAQLPDEIIDPNDPDILKARLERDYAATVTKFAEHEVAITAHLAKLKRDHPETKGEIKTEAEATKIVDFVAQQVRPLTAQAKKDHDRENKPHLECSKVIHAFFLRRIEALEEAIVPLTELAGRYRKAKEAEQRRKEAEARAAAERARQAAEAEAARLAENARLFAEQGNRQAATTLLKEADKQAEQASAAARIITAAPAPVRISGDYGASAFSVAKWAFNRDDIDLALLPPRYWMPNLDLIQADIDKAKGQIEIPGVLIFDASRTQIRRC